jgi:glycosyltransferase involved in cell wall biosynthesis
MKVANIILESRFGGPQNQILQVSRRLKKYDIETVVIMPKKDSKIFYEKLVAKKIEVKRLILHGLTKRLPQLACWILFFIPELFCLYSYLRKTNIKLVQCTGAWQMKGILAGKLARAKVILRLQDTWAPMLVRVFFAVLARFFCDGFIVAGNSVKQYYLNESSLKSKKAVEIQASVDAFHFSPEGVREDELLARMPGLRIATIGNINPDKGLEYFVEMARILNRRHRNLNFYIVGAHLDSQKKYSKHLYELVTKHQLGNVFFYGISNTIPSILKATDIYVCASVREASPNAVWEAMAMEKAIVSTDVGEVKRFVQNGKNGFIVPPRNAEALAEKMTILIGNENLRNDFGKRSRQIVLRELDVEICAGRYQSFYFEVMKA